MYVLFDIGGTKTRVAASEDLVTFGQPVKFETPADFDAALLAFRDAVATVTGGARVDAAAGGIRGQIDAAHHTLLRDSVLSGWSHKPLRESLERVCGAPVHLENDAAVAGLGEAVFGAGKGYDIVAYHTVSTGVGGARIAHGQIDPAAVNFEPGQQVIDADRTLAPWAASGTLEDIVSGSAMERRFGKKPYEVPQADGVWDELAGYLAYGLRNTVMYWSPDLLVLGGSMVVGDPRILREDIERHLREVLGEFPKIPDVRDAALGDVGGLYGAMALIDSKKSSRSS